MVLLRFSRQKCEEKAPFLVGWPHPAFAYVLPYIPTAKHICISLYGHLERIGASFLRRAMTGSSMPRANHNVTFGGGVRISELGTVVSLWLGRRKDVTPRSSLKKRSQPTRRVFVTVTPIPTSPSVDSSRSTVVPGIVAGVVVVVLTRIDRKTTFHSQKHLNVRS